MKGPKVAEGRDKGPAFDGVMLDLFGTLVDFRSTFQRTLGRILVENDLTDRADTFQEKWQSFVFQGEQDGTFITVRKDFERSLERVLTYLGVNGDLEDYCNKVITEMFESLRVADLFSEVPTVIDALDVAGITWAVVSNVDEADLQALLAHHGLGPTVTVSSEAVASYKPGPGPFERALDGMRLTADRVIHAGDSPLADVVGATSCGIATLWVNRYDDTYPRDLPRPGWEHRDLSPVPRLVVGDK